MKSTFLFIIKNAKPYYGVFFKIILCIIIMQGISLVAPYISGLIIDNFFGEFNFNYVLKLVLITLGLNILSRLIHILQEYIDVNQFFFDFLKQINLDGVQKILQFSVGQHTGKNSGIKDSIMTKGVGGIRTIIQTFVYDVIPLALKVVVILTGLFIIDWQFGVLATISVATIGFLQSFIAKQYTQSFQKLEKLGQERHKGFWEVLRNIFLVKNSGRENYAYEHIDELFTDEHEPGKKHWSGFLNKLTLSSSLVPVFSAMMILLAAWKIGQGDLTPGMFVVISTWSGMLFSEIYVFQFLQRSLSSNLPSIKEYQEFLELEPDIKMIGNPFQPKFFEGSLEFQKVSFKYPDEEGRTNVLKNVSFNINPKETIGIVGKSGSGKSTLTKLLLRNYDPNKGSILIDGHNLKKLDLAHYLQNVGYVEQSTQLFDMTIRENLAFVTDRELSEEDFNLALKQAGLLEFVQGLHNGLDTKIGEQGVKLSGGQRQRLAIARALIKKPAILILDEATASLDTEKEREIQEAIDNLAKENISATKIVIAHRLSTIVNADRIFVFDKGRLVDAGPHKELLERCEIYQTLYNLQHSHTLS